MKTTGVTQDGMHCAKCGVDLRKMQPVFVSNWDGAKEYGYIWNCRKCRNEISQTYTRDKNDLFYTAGEDDDADTE